MQLNEEQAQELEKQGYRLVGNHSAVKTCGWTRTSLAGKGTCYKEKFYGIKSHQCLQMTSCMYCANRCLFCWRGEKAPVSKSWYGEIDDPKEIVDNAIKEHIQLLQGFKANKDRDGNSVERDEKLVSEMEDVKHVA